MIVLDTDILSLYFLGHPKIVAQYKNATQEVVTTVISQIEVLQGRFDTVMKAANGKQLSIAHTRLVQAETDLLRIRKLPIDARAVERFDKLCPDRGLRKIGRADLLIACIALASDGTLITRNVKHFRLVPGLKLENWAN